MWVHKDAQCACPDATTSVGDTTHLKCPCSFCFYRLGESLWKRLYFDPNVVRFLWVLFLTSALTSILSEPGQFRGDSLPLLLWTNVLWMTSTSVLKTLHRLTRTVWLREDELLQIKGQNWLWLSLIPLVAIANPYSWPNILKVALAKTKTSEALLFDVLLLAFWETHHLAPK